MTCQSFTPVAAVSYRTLTFGNLIPRSSYNFAVRADSQDPMSFTPYTGSFSPQINENTTVPQGLQFFCMQKNSHYMIHFLDLGLFLDGVTYPPNVALALTDIGVDGDSLRCLTPLIPCCRLSDNPNGGAQGDWRYPGGSIVPSRSSGQDISRTRGASSVLLHRVNNAMSPTGVYSCVIPYNSTTTGELKVYLYAGLLTGNDV